MKINWIMIAVTAITGLDVAEADLTWPAEDEWTALMRGQDMYYDAIGDQSPGAVDLIGTTDTYSAGYRAFVEDGDIDIGDNLSAWLGS